MQNIVLTRTGGGSESVTIYAAEVTENSTKKLAVIPIPTSTRSTTSAKTRIVDLQRIATEFTVRGHLEDEQRTQLNGSLNSTDTTITVDSTTGFASSGLVKVGLELCLYTGTTATTFTGVTRGVEGTTAISHADNTHIFIPAAQFRDDLFIIYDYGGAFQLAYRRKNWSCVFNGLKINAMANDEESPRVFDVEFTATVGEDLIVKTQSTSGGVNLITGRN